MKNICTVILAAGALMLGSMAALAQSGNVSFPTGSANPSNSGSDNSAFGDGVLFSNTTGFINTATGFDALHSNTTGNLNTATGVNALFDNSTGNGNTAISAYALDNNTSGSKNTAIGYASLFFNTNGAANTAVGVFALESNTTGVNNIALGVAAGDFITTGSYNIDIGNIGASGDTDVIRIGNGQTAFYAAGIDGAQVSGVPVYIDGNGQLGTVNSSIRFKEDVHDMGDASSRIFQLRPVTYRYKQPYADGTKPIDYGLIAEEVAKVYPDMVVKGEDGQIQTVQYQKLTPMLLNEVQKQHQLLSQQSQLLEQQQQTIAQQGEAIRQLKERQTSTIEMLEKRLAALESAQPSSDPAIRPAAE